ncbi:hypothetical protein FOMPIDRAFT_1052990 [Fomitopsis schrenkii]|uniref:Uncharacterized protein n=1 Tax=Fomitopsis schrenkii TaxID=2126942 RepID=S8DUD3_FOMSC|nr:hypothetical protein FOMPIDRAFT_1052990 [Fomitopsis schrenkii]
MEQNHGGATNPVAQVVKNCERTQLRQPSTSSAEPIQQANVRFSNPSMQPRLPSLPRKSDVVVPCLLSAPATSPTVLRAIFHAQCHAHRLLTTVALALANYPRPAGRTERVACAAMTTTVTISSGPALRVTSEICNGLALVRALELIVGGPDMARSSISDGRRFLGYLITTTHY